MTNRYEKRLCNRNHLIFVEHYVFFFIGDLLLGSINRKNDPLSVLNPGGGGLSTLPKYGKYSMLAVVNYIYSCSDLTHVTICLI